MSAENLSSWLSAFTISERTRYDPTDNNRFAFDLGQIIRYAVFLDVVYARYVKANRRFVDSWNELQALTNESRAAKPHSLQVSALMDARRGEDTELHLEIESYFLFAKILLDKAAHFVEVYLGSARAAGIRSHDKWRKNYERFTASKGLTWNPRIKELIEMLQARIVDHRDKGITHRQGTWIYGTSIHPDDATAVLQFGLYPQPADKYSTSPKIGDAHLTMNEYLPLLIETVCNERRKSVFKLVGSRDLQG
jgi:hypothetical protein